MIPLDQFADNDQLAYEVRLGRVQDIPAPRTQLERVAKQPKIQAEHLVDVLKGRPLVVLRVELTPEVAQRMGGRVGQ